MFSIFYVISFIRSREIFKRNGITQDKSVERIKRFVKSVHVQRELWNSKGRGTTPMSSRKAYARANRKDGNETREDEEGER